MKILFPFLLAAASSVFLLGCGSDDENAEDEEVAYNPNIDPLDFVASVDNPLWPLVPGTVYTFEGGGETIVVTVTSDTKEILGITSVVVRDTAYVSGEITEDTFDWYAQDRDGNVWYMGEDTKEYEGSVVVSTEGSWEAGVDGAKPGIVMHGTQPPLGEPYRQEYYAGEAEDMAEVVSASESVSVPFGDFDGCLETHDYTPLDPEVSEYKYYCEGVGLVLEVEGDVRVELTDVSTL